MHVRRFPCVGPSFDSGSFFSLTLRSFAVRLVSSSCAPSISISPDIFAVVALNVFQLYFHAKKNQNNLKIKMLPFTFWVWTMWNRWNRPAMRPTTPWWSHSNRFYSEPIDFLNWSLFQISSCIPTSTPQTEWSADFYRISKCCLCCEILSTWKWRFN